MQRLVARLEHSFCKPLQNKIIKKKTREFLLFFFVFAWFSGFFDKYNKNI